MVDKKRDIIIYNLILIALSLVFGSFLIVFNSIYIKNITILNTFFVLSFIYLFQLVTEFLKILSLFERDNRKLENKTSFLLFKSNFIIVNFFNFILISLVALIGFLCSFFLTNLWFLFIILCSLLIGFIYSLYIFYLFKIESGFTCIKPFKQSKMEYVIMYLTNSLIAILLITAMFFLQTLGNVILITITNSLLSLANFKYIKHRLM